MDIQRVIDSIYLAKNDIDAVARFFELLDFRVLHKEFYTPLGALDLLVTDENQIIVVLINPNNAIKPSVPLIKRVESLSKAVSSYLKRFQLRDMSVRFDIVNIDRKCKTISHKANAFDCYLNYKAD